jgi:hypothetical protein
VLPLTRFHGIEIMNGARLTRGEMADATPLWDGVSSLGYRLWGLANDDSHKLPGEDELFPFTAYNMLLCTELTKEGVLTALHRGSFYASSGLLFTALEVAGSTVVVDAPEAESLQFIGRGGRILHQAAGPRASYEARGDEGYVRVVASGAWVTAPRNAWQRQAWSQPFWIEEMPVAPASCAQALQPEER